MEYIDVTWLHQSQDDPIRLVSELDADRHEVRKLEIFRNGTVGFASQLKHSPGTQLGYGGPIPSLDEINQGVEFHAAAISAGEFEKLWAAYAPTEA